MSQRYPFELSRRPLAGVHNVLRGVPTRRQQRPAVEFGLNDLDVVHNEYVPQWSQR